MRDIQQAVIDLQRLGRMPASHSAGMERIELYQKAIVSIRRPVNRAEVAVLLGIFGEDDLFGLMWPLVHAVESCEAWPLEEMLAKHKGHGIEILKQRARERAEANVYWLPTHADTAAAN